MRVIVDGFGSFVGKHSERLVVRNKTEIVQEVPLFEVEHVLVIASGVSLSSDVIRECTERGIPITFVDRKGDVYASILSPDLTGTVKTRREQLLAYLDERGVAAAKAFAAGKIQNQANLLKYMAKYRKAIAPDLHETVRNGALEIEQLVEDVKGLKGGNVDELRPHLMNREGRAGHLYWQTARQLIPDEIEWEGREGRGAQDLVNSMLNYGYGVLYTQVQQAIVLAGLDPYAGFVHVDRAGKPSLVLDLVEEFRQPIVDRSIFALLNQGVSLEMDGDRLADATRRIVAQRVIERLDADDHYEGKKHKLRTIVQSQARHLATFLRGEGRPYRPFVARW
ncbi:MAG: CRISPR-associated endonuclease Cas1 [Dehalococcoidales bacterium]|nr:CRISPR-associated endonuclease Cas1 [Dehalococcoidales bacterium]